LGAIPVALWRLLAGRTAVADWRKRDTAALWSTTLGQLLRIGAVYVVLVGIEALQVYVHRPEFVLEHFVLFVCLAGVLGVAWKAHQFVLIVDCRVREELNVLDCFEAVSDEGPARMGACLPLERISHLLAFVPPDVGTALFRSSNKSFISLLRFRSASLWLTRNSGVRL
jgi:hypothetical protein